MNVLEHDFYECETLELAKNLIGKILYSRSESGDVAGIIVETEAYLGMADPASHSAIGQTKRNAPMFARAGLAYVYLIYGMHHCFNVTSGPEGIGEAVLIRALEPVLGVELMQERRGITDSRSLCNGPGKVCKSFNIDRSFNYTSLVDGDLTIRQPPPESPLKNKIVTTTRIGITKGIELSYRFILDGSHYISRSMKI